MSSWRGVSSSGRPAPPGEARPQSPPRPEAKGPTAPSPAPRADGAAASPPTPASRPGPAPKAKGHRDPRTSAATTRRSAGADRRGCERATPRRCAGPGHVLHRRRGFERRPPGAQSDGAVRCGRPDPTKDVRRGRSVLRELRIARACRHPAFVALLGAGLRQRCNGRGPVICELADARATTDLQRVVNAALQRAAVFATAATRKAVCVQLVAALTHLHNVARAVYRDIKPPTPCATSRPRSPGPGLRGTAVLCRRSGSGRQISARRGAWGRTRRAAPAPSGSGPRSCDLRRRLRGRSRGRRQRVRCMGRA